MENEYLAHLGTEQVNERSLRLDNMNGLEIAQLMNSMDAEVATAVTGAVPVIGQAIEAIAKRLQTGGRLFYLGAGTSGRLGVLDASECPPTFSVPHDLVIGIIAGGDTALRNAIEGAEDDDQLAKRELEAKGLNAKDAVCAISASGYAPYCIGALEYAKQVGALTIALSCNCNARMSAYADIPIETPTGAEVLSGSTRLKAGTATKMVLNMLTTGAMVLNGKVYQNLMVDLSVTNAKLKDRSIRILRRALDLNDAQAQKAYEASGHNLKAAIVMKRSGATLEKALAALESCNGFVGKAIQKING